MKITYAVRGMMEWNALIPAGRSTLRVRFSGGSATGYGVSPATFTTNNRAVQRIIEESSFFRNGKIFIQAREGNDLGTASPSAVRKKKGGAASAVSTDPIARMMEMRERRDREKKHIYNKEEENLYNIYNKEKEFENEGPEK